MEEDICRRDDRAREGEGKGLVLQTDGIRSGRGRREGARIADGVGRCRGDEMALGKGGRARVGSCQTSPSFPVPSSPHFPEAVRCEEAREGESVLESITHRDGSLSPYDI